MRNTDLVYNSIRKTLGRHKNIQYPKIPRTILEIQNEFKKPEILNKYGFNFENDAKFYVGTVVLENHAFPFSLPISSSTLYEITFHLDHVNI